MTKIRQISITIAVLGLAVALFALPLTMLAAGDYWVYRDAPTAGWTSWSWGGTVNFSDTGTVYAGTNAIRFSATAKWGSLSLQSATPIANSSQYAGIEFYGHGGSGKELLWIYLTDTSGARISPLFNLGETSSSWQKFFVPMQSLETSSFGGINIQTDTIGDFYVDELRLIAPENMPPSPAKMVGRKVSGNLVFWDQGRGFQSIRNNLDAITEVSPVWYTLDSFGNVLPYRDASGRSYEDAGIVSYLKSNSISVTPTLSNFINGVWQVSMVQNVLNNETLRTAHISSILSLVTTRGYDGIDLDYESLTSADRAAFTSFVQALAGALHAQGKTLAVNLHAKTSEPGAWNGPQSQDWAALGQAVDQARIMAYDYSWDGSAPGPVALPSWVDSVLGFASTTIPKARIMQGVPLYGYDWVGTQALNLMWSEHTDTARLYGATIQWDSVSQSPWFKYTKDGVAHEVWFENAVSTDAKLALTNKHGIAGVNFWRLGGEDPGTWDRVRSRFNGATPPPPPTPPPEPAPEPVPTIDTTAPSVTITQPANGATVSGRQTIAASATDNIGVTLVDFYASGKLLSTDAAAPYTAVWDTRRVSAGTYTIKAVAADAAGNLGSHEISVAIGGGGSRGKKGASVNIFSKAFSTLFCSIVNCAK